MSKALSLLEHVYLTKKETLVHADLHANNVLYRKRGDEDENSQSSIIDDDENLQLKVIDFEKCCYGPAGLDFGIYLTNYLWYFVAHSNQGIRRRLSNQVSYCFDAYRSAFYTQLTGSLRILQKTKLRRPVVSPGDQPLTSPTSIVDEPVMNIPKLIEDICADAMAFAALYAYFLCVTIPDVEVLSMKNVPGYNWGDSDGRDESIRRRMILLIYRIFADYVDYKEEKKPFPFTSSGLAALFKTDDEMLSKDHITEFWF